MVWLDSIQVDRYRGRLGSKGRPPIMTATKLKVAIVGAGPGGLAATIQLLRLPGVEVSVFEQARELREVGAVSSVCD